MSKRLRRAILFASVLFVMVVSVKGTVFADQEPYMNIYGIYANTSEKGDSVLLESDGEYLLMDLGMSSHLPSICSQLDELGAVHINIYISHLHIDHVGGSTGDWLDGLKYLYGQGFEIDKLYLPDPSVAPESNGYAEKYELLASYMDQYMGGRDKIVYLKQGSKFRVGYAEAEVLGPSPEFVRSIHPSDYKNRVSEGDEGTEQSGRVMDTYYENNCSLITRISCGGIRYLTTGDMLKDEAEHMVKTYGSKLKADIYKMAHHGTATGNTIELLEMVDPVYCLAQNAGFSNVDSSTQLWRFYGTCQIARETSMPYYIANEMETIIYHVEDGQISLYQGATIDEEAPLTGWVGVYGADGIHRDKDYYYIGEDGIPLTGVQTIDEHTFFFNAGGCMDYGVYDVWGNYTPWKTYSNGRERYFEWSDDGSLAYMRTGFSDIDGKRYYFDKKGLKLDGSGVFELLEIEKATYGVNPDGTITLGQLVNYEDQNYYFASDGKMAVKQIVVLNGRKCYFGTYGTQVFNKIISLNGKRYYFDETGEMAANEYRVIDDNNYYFHADGVMACREFMNRGGNLIYFGKYGTQVIDQIAKIGKEYYYFDVEGYMVRGQLYDYNNKTYYFDDDGVMARKQIVSYEGNKYYFGKYGTQVVDQFVNIDKKSYYFDTEGSMVCGQLYDYKNKTYYFDKDGVMAVNQIVSYKGNKYYFGKYGTMVCSKKVRIDGAAYYFGEDGVMYRDRIEQIGEKTYIFDEDGKMKVYKEEEEPEGEAAEAAE